MVSHLPYTFFLKLLPVVYLVIETFTFHQYIFLFTEKVNIYILHSALSTLIQSTTKNLYLSLMTSKMTPGHSAFPPDNSISRGPTTSGAALRNCSSSSSYTISMDLDQYGPPNPFKLFYIIFSENHRLPTAFSPIPILLTSILLFRH